MRRAFIMALVLMAPVALADWSNEPDGSDATSAAMKPFPEGQFVFYYDFSDTSDSGNLSVGPCKKVCFHYDPDEDGSNTGATVKIRESSEKFSSSNCSSVGNVVTFLNKTGDTELETFDGLTDATTVNCASVAGNICVDVQANASSDDARMTAYCR